MSVCLFGYRYTSYFISVVFASAYIYFSGISAVSLDALSQRALHIYACFTFVVVCGISVALSDALRCVTRQWEDGY